MELFGIFFATIFIHNIALRYFLGWCPLVSLSKELDAAWGMGVAVTVVITLTAAINWFIYHFLLIPLKVEYLQYIAFIMVIASTVQVLEMVLEKFFPRLATTMGIFLPLITVNCAVLGTSLFMILREFPFLKAIIFAFGSSLGFLVAIVALASIREKLRFANVPEPLQGAGIVMLIAGLMAYAFMAFIGMISLG